MASAFDDAFDAALTKTLEALPPEAKAGLVISKEKEKIRAKFAQAQKTAELTRAAGVSTARECLLEMVLQSDAPAAKKEGLKRRVLQIPHIRDMTAMNFDIERPDTKQIEKVSMGLVRCEKDFDPTAEFGKIKDNVTPDRWGEICKELGKYLLVGREAYRIVFGENKALVDEIIALHPDATAQILAGGVTCVDQRNSTVYLIESWGHRVGFKVLDA